MRLPAATLFALVALAAGSVRAADEAKGAAALSLLKTIDEGFVQIFEKVAPSVVVIEATKRAEEEDDEALKGFEFFLDEGRDAPKSPRKDKDPAQSWKLPAPPSRSEGSGFIIRPDGVILTNHHVIADAEKIRVRLKDGRTFPAKLIGADDKTDIAVLRIDAKDLPVVRLGDPKSLEVGDPVLAIGAPYGLEQTATQGIVSAKGRSLPGDAVVPFIQTDAAVNPGNSGGPLFDGSGSVVGINAQIYSRSGGFQGLSFAIPIDVALKVKNQIVATGKATHGRLGVTVQDLNQSLADSFGMKRVEGALVSNVAPGSAAADAGLKSGDVITEVNGEPVVRSGSLSSLIGLSAPGERVKLKVWRDHAERSIEARLGGAEEREKQLADAGSAAEGGQLGLSLRPLTREEKREAKLDAGLLVEDVGGAAARAGIEAGDVLLAINGKTVQSIEQVKSVLAGKPKSVALLVQRDGEKIFVPVKVG